MAPERLERDRRQDDAAHPQHDVADHEAARLLGDQVEGRGERGDADRSIIYLSFQEKEIIKIVGCSHSRKCRPRWDSWRRG